MAWPSVTIVVTVPVILLLANGLLFCMLRMGACYGLAAAFVLTSGRRRN
jgi:hypothetical protein